MKPPSIIACATVFPFSSTSLTTSSAWEGCSTRWSTKNSVSCLCVIDSRLRGAHASRVLVSTSRRNNLSFLFRLQLTLSSPKKSSRSGGRARQHARRVRYPIENLSRSSAHVSDGDRNHFLRRSETGQHLAHAVFAQCPHAQFTGSLPEDKGRGAFVDHVAHFIVDYEILEYAHSSFVANVTTLFASNWLHYLRFRQTAGLNS